MIQEMLGHILSEVPAGSRPKRAAPGRQISPRRVSPAQQAEFDFPRGRWAEFCQRSGIAGLNLAKLKCEGNYAIRANEQIRAIEWLGENSSSVCLISAPTGSGKTLIELIAALSDLKVKSRNAVQISVIVTPRINLTYQHALHEATEVITDKTIPVIAVSSGNKSKRKKDFKAIAQAGRGIVVITPETYLKELKKDDSILATAKIKSLTLDEAHHISEGAEQEIGKSPYAKVVSRTVEKDPDVSLRLFSATHFTDVRQGERLVAYFSKLCSARKVTFCILDLPPPELFIRKIKVEQVPEYYRLRKVLDSAVTALIEELAGSNKSIRKMLEEIAENPSDGSLSKKYFNYIHDKEYKFSERGAFYSAPALIGILRHAVQLLNEPAVCSSLIFALAAFAYQDQREVVRTFGKNFNASDAFNEESKTYADRIRFARKFLKKMFAEEDAPLFKAFCVLALKHYPEDRQYPKDEVEPELSHPSISKLRYIISNEVDHKMLAEMEELIAKKSFRGSSRVTTLLVNLVPDDRELIYYNRVDLAEAVVKIIKKVYGREIAVAYTSKQSEKESEENLARILQADSGVTKLVMTSKAGEGKNIPKAKRLYVCSVPNTALELVQLYGRVGRDGQPGEVVLLLTDQEVKSLERLEKQAAAIVPAFKALKDRYR